MAQADYVISANPTGLAMRTEVNQIFQAILTSNAGTVAPSTVSAGMLWGDMSNSSTFYLKIRNHTNDGWNDLYAYDVATKTIQAMANGSTVSALLSAKANLASPTFTGTVVLPSTTSIGTVSNTEIGYLDGVTSAIQTQLGTKANSATTLSGYGIANAYTKTEVDSKPTGFKNYIINGKKQINQRGLTSTDNSYNQDRWYKVGNNWYQGIEGDNNLINGKTYTLSWVGNATASYYVGNATSTTINSQSFTTISNGGSFTLTISAGQNIWVKFVSDGTGTTFNFVQLEEGSVATPFEQRPYGLELSLCQRYYEVSDLSGNPAKPAWNWIYYKVVKRAVPSLGLIGSSAGADYNHSSSYNGFRCPAGTQHNTYGDFFITASAEL